METFRDCKNRIACKGDAATGMVESLYKGFEASAQLSIGAAFIVKRDGVVTKITRVSTTAFQVESYYINLAA